MEEVPGLSDRHHVLRGTVQHNLMFHYTVRAHIGTILKPRIREKSVGTVLHFVNLTGINSANRQRNFLFVLFQTYFPRLGFIAFVTYLAGGFSQ